MPNDSSDARSANAAAPLSATTPESQPEGSADALKSKMSVGRIFNAARYSGAGLKSAWTHEAAFRQDLALVALHLALVFAVPLSAGWRTGLVAWAIGLLAAEITNSAIEACVDLICQGQRHELAKRAKDMGSALVALWLAIGAVVWIGALWAPVCAFLATHAH